MWEIQARIALNCQKVRFQPKGSLLAMAQPLRENVLFRSDAQPRDRPSIRQEPRSGKLLDGNVRLDRLGELAVALLQGSCSANCIGFCPEMRHFLI